MGWAMIGGLVFGIAVPILHKMFPKAAPYMPRALAVGIAFIVYPQYPITMFLGSMVLVLWRRLNPVQCKALVFATASGLIAGEGVMNLVMGGLTLACLTWKWF